MKKFLYLLLIAVIAIQFFRIDTSVPEVSPASDFISITNPSNEVESILKTSCYDCHSYETKYPWYSNIAPVSWWLKYHINDGRKHLNFSIWGEYSSKKADHKLEECVEEVEEGEMPLGSYTITHSEAKLNSSQKKLLEDFFQSLRTFESEDD